MTMVSQLNVHLHQKIKLNFKYFLNNTMELKLSEVLQMNTVSPSPWCNSSWILFFTGIKRRLYYLISVIQENSSSNKIHYSSLTIAFRLLQYVGFLPQIICNPRFFTLLPVSLDGKFSFIFLGFHRKTLCTIQRFCISLCHVFLNICFTNFLGLISSSISPSSVLICNSSFETVLYRHIVIKYIFLSSTRDLRLIIFENCQDSEQYKSLSLLSLQTILS